MKKPSQVIKNQNQVPRSPNPKIGQLNLRKQPK